MRSMVRTMSVTTRHCTVPLPGKVGEAVEVLEATLVKSLPAGLK